MREKPESEESDTSFSKTVIIYGEKLVEVGLGYYDFEMNEWLHLGENTFLLKCWCYVPDPVDAIKASNWASVAPRGYLKSFL